MFEPIGFLESCYKDRFGTPRQSGLVGSSSARLKILPQFQPEDSLQGLEGFSHIWLLFEFHKNTNIRFHAKVHPPRLQGDSIGVFASRSPHRPNPIGLSLVQLDKIEQSTLFLSGIDLIDGTPIVDIKPYLPATEALPEARVGWTGTVANAEYQVHMEHDIQQTIDSWSERLQKPDLQDLIVKTLQLDPRPLVYRESEGRYRETHAVRLFDGDIHFKFFNKTDIQVIEIKF